AMRHRGPDIVHMRDVPALQRRRAFHAALVDLERRTLGVVALDSRAKAVLEIQPPHLAVADHVEASTFLQLDCGDYCGIFYGSKAALVDAPLVELHTRVFQVLRAQQATHYVSPDGLEVDHSSPFGPPLMALPWSMMPKSGDPLSESDHAQTKAGL